MKELIIILITIIVVILLIQSINQAYELGKTQMKDYVLDNYYCTQKAQINWSNENERAVFTNSIK